MGHIITRDPSAASSRSHDLIVVGGGIYGVCLAYEAVRRGLQPLLIERDDYGGATSGNSLRIVHGGLRYLQSLDIRRHRESVQERQWFLRMFPSLVRPLPCLMPLYGKGLMRPTVMRAALRLNDALSSKRNVNMPCCSRLPNGRVLSELDTRLQFPHVQRHGLCGGALWHDAVMRSPQRIIISILRRAVHGGAMALNYTEGTQLLTHRNEVQGVVAVDRMTREMMEFRAPIVINAAGPWCSMLAREVDGGDQHEHLYHPSLAYNLLINRAPLASCAVAVNRGAKGARTYFLHPTPYGVLAGTEHLPVRKWDGTSAPKPTDEQLAHTLDELNAAIPGWKVSRSDVTRVYSGLLPVRTAGTTDLCNRTQIIKHAERNGPQGLYSISGIKFTTARRTAEQVIRMLGKSSRSEGMDADTQQGEVCPCELDLVSPEELLTCPKDVARMAVRRVIQEESVVTMDDLLHRRTSWLDDPQAEGAVRKRVKALLHDDSATDDPHPNGVYSRSAVDSMDRRAAEAMLLSRAPAT